MKNPDEQVGERIVARLKKEKLLSGAALDKLAPKLIAGSLSSLDWRFVFETDRPKKKDTK